MLRALKRNRASAVLCVLSGFASGPLHASSAGFWRPAIATGDQLGCLIGTPAAHVQLTSCRQTCEPIPWQLDERDADGRRALTNGPAPNPDESPDVIDANDELAWMLEDGGREMQRAEFPAGATCALELGATDGDKPKLRVYAFALTEEAPRSRRSYVHYDAGRDVMVGQSVAMGFGGPTPRHLALVGPAGAEAENLLDRLKVHVSTRFLGLIPVGRDEGHLGAELVAYRSGPIRVIRRQHLWVYVGFGIRSQLFASDAIVYRDFAELPVNFHLNYPPTHFFWPIEVDAVLDFRDLRGWDLLLPRAPQALRIGSASAPQIARANDTSGDWFALRRPGTILVEHLRLGPSLTSVKVSLSYAETNDTRPPEDVRGEMPGLGFRLTDWDDVGNGQHAFTSVSYALPDGYDVEELLREERQGVEIEGRTVLER